MLKILIGLREAVSLSNLIVLTRCKYLHRIINSKPPWARIQHRSDFKRMFHSLPRLGWYIEGKRLAFLWGVARELLVYTLINVVTRETHSRQLRRQHVVSGSVSISSWRSHNWGLRVNMRVAL